MAYFCEAQRRVTAWCFITLLLGERAVAIRTASSDMEDETDVSEALQRDGARSDVGLAASLRQFEGLEGLDPNEAERMQSLHKLYQEAKTSEAAVNCEQLQGYMVSATERVIQELHLSCSADTCDFEMLNLDRLGSGQEVVTTLAAAADKKKCLPLVMGSRTMQQKLGELLSLVDRVLNAWKVPESQARIQEAYMQLVTFQQGTLALEDGMADRQLLLEKDIQNFCPSPCQRCDHHGSSAFEFRCLLKGSDKNRDLEMAGRHGVTCDAPRRRWFRWFSHSRQCQVADWQESAVQHLHISAMLSCATTTMLMGLNGELPQAQRRDMHRICLKLEQGNTITPAEEQQYTAQLNVADEVVPNGLKRAFKVVLVFGLASGLAGLRAATRGNERLPVLLQEGEALEPADFSAPFAALLGAEGRAIRAEDRVMYSDRELIGRAETLHMLTVCGDVYNLRAQNTFAEGARPLSAMQANVTDPAKPYTWQGLALGVVVGTLLSYVWVQIVYKVLAPLELLGKGLEYFLLFMSLLGISTPRIEQLDGVLSILQFTYTALLTISVLPIAIAVYYFSIILLGKITWFSDYFNGGGTDRMESCMKEVNATHALAIDL